MGAAQNISTDLLTSSISTEVGGEFQKAGELCKQVTSILAVSAVGNLNNIPRKLSPKILKIEFLFLLEN